MRTRGKDALYWALGILLSALGLSFSTKSALGLSMIGALPYILHVWLRDAFPLFTQGMAEYVWQAVVLLALSLAVRAFKPRWLLSFGTAVLSGFAIDLWLGMLGGNGPWASPAARGVSFLAGACITAAGIACFFRTDMPVAVYELAVKEFAARYQLDRNRVKLGFDAGNLALAVALSRLLTHTWTGVGPGTVLITCLNAPLIALFGRLIDRLDPPAS